MTTVSAQKRTTVFHRFQTRTAATLALSRPPSSLPQLFHLAGAAAGQTFLPMHLPILLVGCWPVR